MKKQISIDYGKLRQELSKAAESFHGYHEWTQEEDDLLREFYGRVDGRVLMGKLHITPAQLYRRVGQLKIDKASRKTQPKR